MFPSSSSGYSLHDLYFFFFFTSFCCFKLDMMCHVQGACLLLSGKWIFMESYFWGVLCYHHQQFLMLMFCALFIVRASYCPQRSGCLFAAEWKVLFSGGASYSHVSIDWLICVGISFFFLSFLSGFIVSGKLKMSVCCNVERFLLAISEVVAYVPISTNWLLCVHAFQLFASCFIVSGLVCSNVKSLCMFPATWKVCACFWSHCLFPSASTALYVHAFHWYSFLVS